MFIPNKNGTPLIKVPNPESTEFFYVRETEHFSVVTCPKGKGVESTAEECVHVSCERGPLVRVDFAPMRAKAFSARTFEPCVPHDSAIVEVILALPQPKP